MARLTARSAATASQVVWSASGASAPARSARPARISMPSAPCPAAGSISSVLKMWRMRSPRPRRLRPAAASTMPAYWPSSSLRRRVSRLPRSGSMRTSRRCIFESAARSSTVRRRLDVPITAPGGKSASVAQPADTQASRGSSRAITQASSKPAGSSIGTSFSECTAMSARPSSSAVSSSFTNRPLPPTLLSVRSRIWSPRVVMPSSATAWPRARSRDWTCSACHRARRDSRVAMVICGEDMGWDASGCVAAAAAHAAHGVCGVVGGGPCGAAGPSICQRLRDHAAWSRAGPRWGVREVGRAPLSRSPAPSRSEENMGSILI